MNPVRRNTLGASNQEAAASAPLAQGFIFDHGLVRAGGQVHWREVGELAEAVVEKVQTVRFDVHHHAGDGVAE